MGGFSKYYGARHKEEERGQLVQEVVVALCLGKPGGRVISCDLFSSRRVGNIWTCYKAPWNRGSLCLGSDQVSINGQVSVWSEKRGNGLSPNPLFEKKSRDH